MDINQKIFDFIFYLTPTIKFLFKCFLSMGLGAFVSASLILSGQRWAKSMSNVSTFIILPLTSFVITSVISGNIALSLGMVGALSIVRFRHPVKTPLELTIYFILITIGIAISTSPSSALVLSILSMTVIYFYGLYISKKSGYESFIPNLNLNSEEPSYILEIKSSKELNKVSKNQNLLFSFENLENSTFTYKLCFQKKTDLDDFAEDLKRNSQILSISVTT